MYCCKFCISIIVTGWAGRVWRSRRTYKELMFVCIVRFEYVQIKLGIEVFCSNLRERCLVILQIITIFIDNIEDCDKCKSEPLNCDFDVQNW